MAYVYPCVSCVLVDLYVPSLRCYRLVLRPVKAMLDRNFRCTVTEYVLAPCSMRKPLLTSDPPPVRDGPVRRGIGRVPLPPPETLP